MAFSVGISCGGLMEGSLFQDESDKTTFSTGVEITVCHTSIAEVLVKYQCILLVGVKKLSHQTTIYEPIDVG